MRLTKLNTGSGRHGAAVLAACLLLGACGLAGGHGSLDAGARYQDEGKYRSAYIEAKKVLQRDEKNAGAWLLLGRASLMLGNPQDALSDLNKAKADGVPKARWAVPMGQTLLIMQKYDEALEALTPDASFDDKTKAQADALRGDAYRGLDKPGEAKQAYKDALAVDPKSARALVGLARLAAADHDTATANRLIQQALAGEPENPQAWIAKGDFAYDSGDFAGAETDYRKVLGFKNSHWLPQENFYTLVRLANAQVHLRELDKALENIKTLEKMSPGQPFPHYLHAVVLYQQGKLDDAVEQLQQVLKQAPDNVQAQMLMGAVQYAQGNYAQAEMYLSNVMGTDARNGEARRLLALTYYREGRSRQALDTLRPAMPGTPTDAQMLAILQRAAEENAATPGEAAHTVMAAAPATTSGAAGGTPVDRAFAKASQALAGGNDAEAIRLLKAMPTGDEAMEKRRATLLVMAYAQDKQVAEAARTAAEYSRKHPNDSGAHLMYGTALIAAGKLPDARTQYNQAIKLDPKNNAALMSLGSLDTLERNYQDATTHYEAALKNDPKNAVTMTALGRLAAMQNHKADAIKWYRQAIAAAPKSDAAYVGLVVLYTSSGQFDDAVKVARQLAEADPHNPAALNALGSTELNAGHHAEALKPLQQAVNLAPQMAAFRTNLARAQLLNKDTQAARENLEKVLKIDPADATAATLLAFVKLQDHDLPGGIALAQSLQKQSAPSTKASGYMLEGDLYAADKSYAKAAAAYQQGLKVQYERPLVVKTFLALNQSGAKDPDAVLHDWLGKHPDDAATRLLLAQYYMDHQQNPQAIEEYEKVLKAFPSNVGALNNLAWIYTEQHDPKALELAERAHKLAPDSASIADTYGWALIAADQPKAALPILEKAAKAAPKVPTIQYHLAVAQSRTGNRAGALSTLESLWKSGAAFPDKPAAEKLYKELGGAATSGAGK